MSRTYGKDYEIVTLDDLFSIGLPKNAELDDIHRGIDARLTFACQLKATNPSPDAILNIGQMEVVLSDGRKQKLAAEFDFTGATINVQTGATTGSVAAFTFPSASVGQYVRMGLSLNDSGLLVVSFNVPDAAVGGAGEVVFDTYPIGVVSLECTGGTAYKGEGAASNVVENNDIIQFLASGGGGDGDASLALVRLEAVLDDSFYQWLEPNIFKLDKLNKITFTNGIVSRFLELDAAEYLVSYSLLDPEFLASESDILKAQVALIFDSTGIDPAPVVELTPNGDLADLQIVVMEQLDNNNNTFVGELVFDLSLLTIQLIDEYDIANEDSDVELEDATNREAISQEFVTNTNTNVVEQLSLYVNKLGSPSGYLKLNLHEDSAGNPGNVVHQSLINISDLILGDNNIVAEIGRSILSPSTKYHLSLETDDTYKTSFSTGVDSLRVRIDSSGSTIADRKEFDGTSWSVVAGSSMPFKIEGRKLDLIMKYTASASAKLTAYGVYYGEEAANTQALKRRNAFVFHGTNDNLNEFQLTFDADPDFLTVRDIFAGQTWQVPAFALQGNKVVFEADYFDGRKEVYLIAQQIEAGSFDGNPENTKLLTENHLGSLDPALDKSVPGRGPIVSAETVAIKVELTVDEDFNLVIKEA